MKEIESFTAVATVLNTERVIRWSSLTGLTIEGLTRTDATAVMRLIETVSQRAQAQATDSAIEPKKMAKTESTSYQNQDAAAPEKRSTSADYVEDLGAGDSSAPKVAATAAKKAPVSAATAAPAPVDPPEQAAPTAVVEPPASKPKSPKKAAPKKRVPRRDPETTDSDPPWKAPVKGDKIDGGTVREVKPTAMGGAVVTLGNGVRIKYDDKGREIGRTEAATKTVTVTPAATTGDIAAAILEKTELEAAPEKAAPSTSNPPDEVMKTRMTRDVLKWVQSQGVNGRDQIIAECERLKASGAVAFATCPDVRQRVTTVLTAMGVA